MKVPAIFLAVASLTSCGGPTYHESTCDFLAAPARYANSTREFVGQVRKTRSGEYAFLASCASETYRFPLEWRGEMAWQEGIFDEAGDPSDQIVGGGKLKGILRKDPATERWEIEALDYGPLRFDL